jgi:hypothetical protein
MMNHPRSRLCSETFVHARHGLAVALATLVLLLVPAFGVSAATAVSVLRYASSGANYAYKLKLMKSCEVGDGLAVVKNVGATPLRLTSIAVLYGDGARANQANTTYELISLRRGTSEGQLGSSFDLTGLHSGVALGNAVGSLVQPIAKSGRSYDIVAKVLVIADHTTPWKITGLRVSYDVGSSSYTTELAQSITVSSTPAC